MDMNFNLEKTALACAETVIQTYISGQSMSFDDIQPALDIFSYCGVDVQSHFNLNKDEMWEYFKISINDNETDKYDFILY
jgi:hypothetical protein